MYKISAFNQLPAAFSQPYTIGHFLLSPSIFKIKNKTSGNKKHKLMCLFLFFVWFHIPIIVIINWTIILPMTSNYVQICEGTSCSLL